MTAPTFDAATLRALHVDLGAELDVTLDIVRTFLQSADDLLREARAGLAAADGKVVQRVAHTLKSGAATVGAMRLYEMSRELELALAARGPTAADVDALADELARARPLIEAWRP